VKHHEDPPSPDRESAAPNAFDLSQPEVALRNETLFSETMLDSMPGALYFYDTDGRFLRWNRNFEDVSGYSREEIAGMHPLDFISPDTKDLVAQRIGEVFDKGVSAVEAKLISKDGIETPYFFTGRRVDFLGKTCLVGVGIDITDRIHAEAMLHDSEQKLRALFQQAPLGIAIINSLTGQFVRVNRQYCQITGYSESEMLSSSFQQITHPDDLQRDLDNMARLQAGVATSFTIEKRYLKKDRDTVWVRLTCVRLNEDTESGPQHIAMVEDITMRKEADLILAESERKYRDLVELANSIILRWDSGGRITFLNEFGLNFFGYSASELVGKHVIGTIVPETESSGRNLQELMDQICANPHIFETNVNENLRRNGERVLISWTNRIIQDEHGNVVEILSVGTDITDRHRAEEARRMSEVRYRTLFEYAPDGIVISAPDGHYVDANQMMCRMLGYTHDELVELHATDIVAPMDVGAIDTTLAALQARMDHHREWHFRRKDGSIFPAEVIATTMPDGNILAMIRDVTERKKAEAALRELNETLELKVTKRTEELQAAVLKAEAADRIKSAFLATMSHELRTPLNSIIGFTGILLQGLAGPLNEEQNKQLDMVRGSARHLLSLINDVLDISKIEAGQFEVDRAPFDPLHSLTKLVSTVAPLAGKKSLALQTELPPTLGQAIGDERRFEQVILNLLSNAIKFTESGTVTLSAEELATRKAIRVSISDTGIGIKEDDLTRLFQPFQQLDTGLSRNYEGTGLGLAICKRLVDLMGGEIVAESYWGQGSVFSVIIPCSPRGPQ